MPEPATIQENTSGIEKPGRGVFLPGVPRYAVLSMPSLKQP